MKNTRVLMAKRPVGEPDQSCFQLEEVDVPELKENEILIKVLWLSLDPYMRGRMRLGKSYAKPLEVGDMITGESAGVVVQSNSPKYAVGEYVAAHKGWQTMIVADAEGEGLMKINLDNGSLSAHLGVVGMPGRTAFFGLTEVGKPLEGETLVVAAASGAVGSAVGQIAKIKGLRVIGIAGGPEKCAYVREELGFDACIDYKAGNLDAELATACRDGIDVYFENVGGMVARAVAPLLNEGARVPICGYVSNYNDVETATEDTPFGIFGSLDPAPEHRFFVVTEWKDRALEATEQLGAWIKEGKLKYKECVGEGIENAPELFMGLLKGKNFGKQLVKIADE